MDQTVKTHALQLTPQDVEAFFTDLGLQNLPDDRKQQMLNTALDTILDRVLMRIAPVLTENDQQAIEQLEKQEDAPQKMLTYITAIVPNFNAIVKEETVNYKRDLKTQIDNIVNTINEEADNSR